MATHTGSLVCTGKDVCHHCVSWVVDQLELPAVEVLLDEEIPEAYVFRPVAVGPPVDGQAHRRHVVLVHCSLLDVQSEGLKEIEVAGTYRRSVG